jgi:hypothetical protein
VGDAHAAVSRRPPISLSMIVARTHMYTNDAKVWNLSIVQGPFSVAPCHALALRFATFHRCNPPWCSHPGRRSCNTAAALWWRRSCKGTPSTPPGVSWRCESLYATPQARGLKSPNQDALTLSVGESLALTGACTYTNRRNEEASCGGSVLTGTGGAQSGT